MGNNTITSFLSELEVYPSADIVNEASDMAQEKATEYVLSLDSDAVVTVEDGEVYINSDVLSSEQKQNAQVIFDEFFTEQF